MTELSNDIQLVLVTGVSGAGNSTALKILEDSGWAVVDNLPLALIEHPEKAGLSPSMTSNTADLL